ncbi:hypothetical protein DKT69_34920 [Micromonospora sicca]|uniref:Uncharacterized protein n=1 Tax=Micromonospora sicca TaxID=2202420 RepID=A0A317CZL0_9ACTN|nr:hypothetical protein DKT69_34920 [Micromonospora sp. 4G51]
MPALHLGHLRRPAGEGLSHTSYRLRSRIAVCRHVSLCRPTRTRQLAHSCAADAAAGRVFMMSRILPSGDAYVASLGSLTRAAPMYRAAGTPALRWRVKWRGRDAPLRSLGRC